MSVKTVSFKRLLGVCLSIAVLCFSGIEAGEKSKKGSSSEKGMALYKKMQQPFRWIFARGKKSVDMSVIRNFRDFKELMEFLGFKGARSQEDIEKVISTIDQCYDDMIPVSGIKKIMSTPEQTPDLSEIFFFSKAPNTTIMKPFVEVQTKLPEGEVAVEIEQEEKYYRGDLTAEVRAAWIVYSIARMYYGSCVPLLNKLEGVFKRKLLAENNMARMGFHTSLAALILSSQQRRALSYTNRLINGYSKTFEAPQLDYSSYYGSFDPRAFQDMWAISAEPHMLKPLNKPDLPEEFRTSIVTALTKRLATDFHNASAVLALQKVFMGVQSKKSFLQFIADVEEDITASLNAITGFRYPFAAENVGHAVRSLFEYLKSGNLEGKTPIVIGFPCPEEIKEDYVTPLFTSPEVPMVDPRYGILDDMEKVAEETANFMRPRICRDMKFYKACIKERAKKFSEDDLNFCEEIRSFPDQFAIVEKDFSEKYMKHLAKSRKDEYILPKPKNTAERNPRGVSEELLTYMERVFVRYVTAMVVDMDGSLSPFEKTRK